MVSLRQGSFPLRLLMLALAVPLLAYLLISSARKGFEVYQVRQQQAEVRAEIERLKDENIALQRQLDYLQSDAYVEYAARTELGLTRPGDHVVVPVPEPGAPPAAAPPAEPPPPAPPTWQRWWDFFFGSAP